MTAKKRLGVVVSGSGSNLQALIDACATPSYPAEIAVVVSNVPTAYGLERAKKAGIRTEVRDHKTFATREAFDVSLAEALQAHKVDWVCHAGFMRIVGPRYLGAFPGKVLNVHPSLLPAFPGLHAVRQAVNFGVRVSGCTVHFVDEGTDTGPIILQAAVPVLPNDDEATLGARILEQEHRIYPEAVRLVVEGRVVLSENKARHA